MDRQIIINYTTLQRNRWQVIYMDGILIDCIREYIDLESALIDAKYWLANGYHPLGQEEIEELSY